MNRAKDFIARSAKAFIAAGIGGVATWFADGGISDFFDTSAFIKGLVGAFFTGVGTWFTTNKDSAQVELAGE